MVQRRDIKDRLEEFERIILGAFKTRQEDLRRTTVSLGLLPGEPVDGGQLDRSQVEEPAAS